MVVEPGTDGTSLHLFRQSCMLLAPVINMASWETEVSCQNVVFETSTLTTRRLP